MAGAECPTRQQQKAMLVPVMTLFPRMSWLPNLQVEYLGFSYMEEIILLEETCTLGTDLPSYIQHFCKFLTHLHRMHCIILLSTDNCFRSKKNTHHSKRNVASYCVGVINCSYQVIIILKHEDWWPVWLLIWNLKISIPHRHLLKIGKHKGYIQGLHSPFLHNYTWISSLLAFSTNLA